MPAQIFGLCFSGSHRFGPIDPSVLFCPGKYEITSNGGLIIGYVQEKVGMVRGAESLHITVS